jgi:hypothetical protein
MAATPHTCGGPVFGRRTAGCPRCDELAAGAKPTVWRAGRRAQANADDARRAAEIRAHDCAASRCGRTCTFGDW